MPFTTASFVTTTVSLCTWTSPSNVPERRTVLPANEPPAYEPATSIDDAATYTPRAATPESIVTCSPAIVTFWPTFTPTTLTSWPTARKLPWTVASEIERR